jgi:serine/threonine protein kinase
LDIDPGTVVANRYRIIRPIGRGGMGEVFAAENTRTGRPVAVKLLRSDSKSKASALARFKREALAAGKINSDHVTQVLDVEDDDEHGVVLVFELLEGESLIDRLKRTGPIPFDELHPIIDQVWMGLSDAHRVGVIHRDLKPSNVFLERRPDGTTRVKILDFGISKLPKEMGGETLTEMGQSLGTFSFMPPEQIGKAKTVDHRADIYACATMIYQSLTGQLPYSARNILVMVEMKSKTDARRLAEAMGGPVDPRLEQFIAQGLEREPSNRFQTALDALSAWRELRPPSRPGASEPASSRPPSSLAASPPRTAPSQRPPLPATRGAGPMHPSTHHGPGPAAPAGGSSDLAAPPPSLPIADITTDSVATLAMPLPHLHDAGAPESAGAGEGNEAEGSHRPMGGGGTQPVRLIRGISPASPIALAAGHRSPSSRPPTLNAADKPRSERSLPRLDEEPQSGRHRAGQASSSIAKLSGGRIFEESTSPPASASDHATQVYRPRDAQARAQAQANANAQDLGVAPLPRRSSPWAFLLGAIAFLLVGFFIVFVLLQYFEKAH